MEELQSKSHRETFQYEIELSGVDVLMDASAPVQLRTNQAKDTTERFHAFVLGTTWNLVI